MSNFISLIPEPPNMLKVSSFVYRWSVFLTFVLGLAAGVWAIANPDVILYIGARLDAEITSGLLVINGVLTVLHDKSAPLPPPAP